MNSIIAHSYKVVFVSSLICITLSSCSRNNIIRSKNIVYSSENNIPLNLDKGFSTDISIFDFCSEVKIVPFESSAGAFVDESTIKNIAFSDYSLFILNKLMILEFDYQGHLLRTIDKIGRGPGEFTMASSIIVNKYTNSLDVLCPSGSIYKYDLSESSEFLGKYDFSDNHLAVHYFTAIDDHRYLLYSLFEEPDVFLYDCETSTLSNIGDFEPSWLGGTAYSPSGSPFFECNDEIFFYTKYDGRVYSFDKESTEFKPIFSWDVGKYSLKIESIEKDKDLFYYEKLCRKNSYRVASPFTFTSYDGQKLFASFRFRGRMHWNTAVYDANKDEVKLFKKTIEGLWFIPGYIDRNSRAMYRLVNPELLHFLVNEKVITDPNDLILLRDISEASNIVMIKYTLL